eukprot:TRINITY_DN2547_c0_g1_i2.p1 TRINITY_DN2547_c0_g1~~TRINITY_DN2547_c0_g1_i2.p1  ORF type:complete len:783 (-),score=213.04 TRINITY_DN2547_c0_g1_i2:389-2737(-)
MSATLGPAPPSVSLVRLNVSKRAERSSGELPPLPLNSLDVSTPPAKKQEEPPQTPALFKRISLPSVHPRKQLQKKFNQLALPPVSGSAPPARRPAAAKGLVLSLRCVRQSQPATVVQTPLTSSARLVETGLESFSDELLLHVFGYLSQTELATQAGLVCRRWCKLSRDKSLWPEINLAAIPERERSGVMERLGGGFKVLRIERSIDLLHASRFCTNIVYLNLSMPPPEDAAVPVPLPRLAACLARLSRLRELHIYPSSLELLPAELPGQLSRLEVLRLIGRRQSPSDPTHPADAADSPDAQGNVAFMPDTIGRFVRLQRLTLYNNNIGALPSQIGALTMLVKLNLSINCISELPAEIGLLRALRWLSLSSNRLTSLPAEVCQLSELRLLNVEDNRLSELPCGFSRLHNLDTLCLAGNRISSIHADFKRLSSVRSLTIRCLCPSLYPSIDRSSPRLRPLPDRRQRGQGLGVSGLPCCCRADWLVGWVGGGCSYSSFTSLPQEVGAWPTLKFINYCHPDLVFSAFTVTHPLLARTRLNYLLRIEAEKPFDATYMSRQVLISAAMRERLIEWLGLQIVKLPASELEPSHVGMLFAAVNIVDRYLATKLVDPLVLQLLGIVALYLGWQLFTHPDAANAISKEAFLGRFDEQFSVELFDYMHCQVRQAAIVIDAPTVLQFYKYFVVACEMQSCIDQYPLQILLEYDFLKFKPSALAVTCVYAERLRSFEFYRNVGLWVNELEVLSGQTLRDVHAMVRVVVDLFVARKIEERTESAEVIAKQVLNFDS